MATLSSRDSLLHLLGPVVGDLGLDLEDIVVTPAGKRRLLRVVVDQDGGVELDQVAKVSSAVSAALDSAEAMGAAPYVLEVTSPGIERPLTELRHWRRNRGRLVEIALSNGSTVRARVVAVSDDGLRVEIEGATHALAWSEVASGYVQVEFSRPATAED